MSMGARDVKQEVINLVNPADGRKQTESWEWTECHPMEK